MLKQMLAPPKNAPIISVGVADPIAACRMLVQNVPVDQFLRELTQNSFEAIQALPSKRGSVIWTRCPYLWKEQKKNKLCIIDTGVGMDADMIRAYFNNIHSSSHSINTGKNHGVGGKISCWRASPHGMEILSWRDGVGYHAFSRNMDGDDYGLIPFSNGEMVRVLTKKESNRYRPKQIRDHGTMIILHGQNSRSVTLDHPDPSRTRKKLATKMWIPQYIDMRFLDIPKGVNLTGVTWQRQTSANQITDRKLYGLRHYLNKDSLHKAVMRFGDFKVHWWVLKEDRPTFAANNWIKAPGYAGLLWKGEIYEMKSSSRAVSALHECGVHIGERRVALFFEPIEKKGSVIGPDLQRTGIHLNGEPIPWSEWYKEFRENLPRSIEKMMAEEEKKLRRRGLGSDTQKLFDQNSSLFEFKQSRLSRNGSLNGNSTQAEAFTSTASAVVSPSGNGATSSKPSTPSQQPTSPTSSMPHLIGEEASRRVFHSGNGKRKGVSEKMRATPPSVETVSVKDGTRDEEYLRGEAATYNPVANQVIMNADFEPLVTCHKELCRRFNVKTYSNEGRRLELELHKHMALPLQSTILAAHRMRQIGARDEEGFTNATSNEALTTAINSHLITAIQTLKSRLKGKI